jgi:hypothetical protein
LSIMDISLARNDHHEALAAGRFGETCALARKHGAMPDPDVFARRFVASGRCASEGCAGSAPHDSSECAHPLSRVA